MTRICFATNNLNKIKEVQSLLGGDFSLVSLEEIGCFEELPETHDTLEGNSFQKAEYVHRRFQITCFADDTGLEVEALNGAPGVYSARYAGEQRKSSDNIQLLLKNLDGIENRKARFRTVITLMREQGVYTFEGVIHGSIVLQQKGVGGFGYDPVFIPEGFDKTFAEMSLEEKNSMSHRAIAIKKLTDFLKR